MSAQLEQQVGMLIEENKELKDRITEIESHLNKMKKEDKHDFEEMMIKIKEFNEKIADFLSRKDGIDKIIEKIKKFLPI